MTPRISFAITTHNEGEYIQRLLDQLIPHCKRTGDEIVILDDYSDDEVTKDILFTALEKAGRKGSGWNLKLGYQYLDGDFANQKNRLNSMCKGEYIFQIDADETVHPVLLDNLHELVEANNIDLFYVPRINIVHGLTGEDISRWGWRVNEKGHVMRPDYQSRLYRNTETIHWQGKVHERIIGFKSFTYLPDEDEYCLIHIKDIDRQRKQNEFYATL